ncbi:MAG: hypothetical protein JNM56_35790 [Planctomycetia bacterium]|nr:hypothetical protein [Planctomycetia bacterium]
MPSDFYTLEQAANVLGVTPDDLQRMNQDGAVHGMEQEGALQFRAQDIDDLARARSLGSNPELDLGTAPELDLGLQAAANDPRFEEDSIFSDSGSSAPPLDFSPGLTPLTGLEPEPSLQPTVGLGPAPEPFPEPNLGSSSEFSIDVPDSPLSPSGAPLSGAFQPPVEGAALPVSEDSLDFGELPQSPSSAQLAPLSSGGAPGGLQGPPTIPTMPKAPGASDVKLDVETGSFEFSMTVDSSGRLADQAGPLSGGPKSSGGAPPASSAQLAPAGGDSDVRLDLDESMIGDGDSLISVGEKPDSDVRLEPASQTHGTPSGSDLMQTEQIDLDAELRAAEEASLVRRTGQPGPRMTKPQPGQSQMPGGKTKALPPAAPTMLPASSPFELSDEDLDLPGSLGASAGGSATSDSAVLGDLMPGGSTAGGPKSGSMGHGMSSAKLGPRAGGSEFELTLAPEEESPLALGDDEDVDLGAAPPKSDMASNRSELSGVHKHAPMDSDAGSSDDAVDFELTVDDEGVTGPKTIKGKLTDSDSEFELTLDEGSSTSLPRVSHTGASASGEQKDIFESTDFEIDTGGEAESASQAVAIDEADTDLESSDFDLAIDEGSADESGSQVMELSDDGSMSGEEPAPRRRSRVSHVDTPSEELSIADSMMDQDLLGAGGDEEPLPEDDEETVPTVPSAQAEWGMVPVILMIPCVLVMFMTALMSYELVNNMWGYHAATKPSGLLVESFAGLFKDEGGN